MIELRDSDGVQNILPKRYGLFESSFPAYVFRQLRVLLAQPGFY